MKIKYALLITVLITVSILPTTNLLAHKERTKQGYADPCSQGVCPYSQHPIMHPDSETLQEWLECYNRAPRTYIDPMLEPPTGSISLLSHLDYNPVERDQGSCGNCWAWAGTGVLEISLDVQEGILDRLSMQYLNSKYNGGTGSNWACCGGWLEDLADFYASEGFVIPWSNTNAAWADGTQSCAGSTSVSWETISTSPNYSITNCTDESITTAEVGQTTAINNIKNVLAQGKAIWFGYFLPTGDDWNQFYDFWNYESEDAIFNPDYSCGHTWDDDGGGHAVLCVGYNDDDPENAYWIMVNSWGTAYGGRPNGIFHLDMNMNYDCYFYDLPFTYYSFYWQTLDVTFNIETTEQADTYLVIRGMDNHIYYSTYNSSSETWGSWLALPGATCDSPAAAVCQNELHIVVRGVTGDLWHGYVNATDSTFSGWTQLSGFTPSAPTLTASATSLYLVVRGNDDKIYYRCWTGSWSGWTALPGATANRTAATVLGDNLHVLVNGLDGNMYHGYVNITTSTFSGWTLLPGATQSPPELAASATKLYLGVRGMNDEIYYNSWDGASWIGWTALPGATMDSPAATVLEDNLHLVVRGTDGNMYHGYLDLADGWSGWTKLSGATPSAPELASALGPPEVVKWAVIVGISDYKAIDDLSYCDEDAADWYNHLSGTMDYDYIWVYGDGHPGNYPQYDGYATEYNVKQALQNVVNQADSDDIIVFTTSGHGSGNGVGSSYLCMWDCDSGENGEDGDLYDTELANILDDAVASRVFVFIDHCYAGGFGDDLMNMGNSDHVYLTTTCTENGYGWDDSEHENGLWTYYFLEYAWINHFGADPNMSMEDVFDYAHDHYPYGGGDEPQEYDGDSANPFYLT